MIESLPHTDQQPPAIYAGFGWMRVWFTVDVVGVAGPVTKRDGIFSYATKRDGVFDRLTKRPGVLA